MFAELLAGRLKGICELTAAQVALLESHYELLLRWNKVINLTAIRNPEEAVERHYCESVFLTIHIPGGQLRVADIGSGAGFPGIPVAVLRPDCEVALIESDHRKSAFLREATRGYANVRVVRERAECVKEEFDWVLSRGVNVGEVDLARLGTGSAILGGELPPEAAGFRWEPRIRLPWGERRHLWVGHRSSGCVSRET